MSLKLTVGCGAYDRTWPLAAGMVAPEGIALEWTALPPEQVFLRGMLGGEFDVTEMSMSTYVLLRSRGACLYTAIPAFVSRKFRHSAVYVRSDAGIAVPQDLKGRRVGVPEYQLTANVWVRGMLADEYGVGADLIEWVIGGIDEPGRAEKVPIALPDRIRSTRLGEGETLWGCLTRGEVDAIIAPRAPRAFAAGDTRIRRLFPDIPAAEKAYFRKTGLFPLMHVVGIRNALVQSDPTLAPRLMAAFDAAKRLAADELHQFAYDTAMLPWQEEHLRETEAVMGKDYWPYGVNANAHAIATLCRYSYEQGIVDRVLQPRDLFAPGVD